MLTIYMASQNLFRTMQPVNLPKHFNRAVSDLKTKYQSWQTKNANLSTS